MRRYEYSEVHMGGRLTLVLYAPTHETAERAARAGFRRIAELEQTMSDYRPDSELMRVVAKTGQGPVIVGADLCRALRRARQVAVLSDGAFDFTASPLIRLWRTARETGARPPPAALEEARTRVGWPRVLVDPVAHTVELAAGTSLDLGGIGKGFAGDEAVAAMRAVGVGRVLVTAGGDIVAGDPPPERAGWSVRVRGAERSYLLANQGLSTSGDSEQFVEIDGVRYSHIVDPRTGLGVTSRIQATVLARDGLTTDPLATALCVLGEARGRALLEKFGAEASFLVGG